MPHTHNEFKASIEIASPITMPKCSLATAGITFLPVFFSTNSPFLNPYCLHSKYKGEDIKEQVGRAEECTSLGHKFQSIAHNHPSSNDFPLPQILPTVILELIGFSFPDALDVSLAKPHTPVFQN